MRSIVGISDAGGDVRFSVGSDCKEHNFFYFCILIIRGAHMTLTILVHLKYLSYSLLLCQCSKTERKNVFPKSVDPWQVKLLQYFKLLASLLSPLLLLSFKDKTKLINENESPGAIITERLLEPRLSLHSAKNAAFFDVLQLSPTSRNCVTSGSILFYLFFSVWADWVWQKYCLKEHTWPLA